MKHKAVIFDLFGTLLDNFEGTRYESVYQQLADLFGLDGPAFSKTWRSEPISTLRAGGHYETFEACLAEVCRVMGVTYDSALIPKALELRMRLTREMMKPRPDTVETLWAIRQKGLKIAVLSDCSWEVPDIWPETPMAPLVDVPVFSCAAKMKKPDPRLYKLICDALQVRGQECLYVGDCGCDELTAAREAGMDAALICVPYEESVVMKRPAAMAWDGPRVSSVSQVISLLDREVLSA